MKKKKKKSEKKYFKLTCCLYFNYRVNKKGYVCLHKKMNKSYKKKMDTVKKLNGACVECAAWSSKQIYNAEIAFSAAKCPKKTKYCFEFIRLCYIYYRNVGFPNGWGVWMNIFENFKFSALLLLLYLTRKKFLMTFFFHSHFQISLQNSNSIQLQK